MPSPIRALVVDDEPIARRTLRLLLAEDPDVELIGECEATEAARLIPEQRPDLLFLDVQMPELDGFSLLERVGIEAVPAVVFVTAHDRHALRAFDVDAVDFLLKPFDDRRFAEAMRRVKVALAGSRDNVAASGAGAKPYARRFVVRLAGRITVVQAADIDWIEAADYYACLHVGDKSYLLRQTMHDLEGSLDPAQFFRIHRSAIVNVDRVRDLVPGAGGQSATVCLDGARLRMARGRLSELRRRLAR